MNKLEKFEMAEEVDINDLEIKVADIMHDEWFNKLPSQPKLRMYSLFKYKIKTRAGLVADFSFWYPASVKPYRFQDTKRRNCVLVYPQPKGPPSGSKICKKKTLKF